jgi:hypothetical protein
MCVKAEGSHGSLHRYLQMRALVVQYARNERHEILVRATWTSRRSYHAAARCWRILHFAKQVQKFLLEVGHVLQLDHPTAAGVLLLASCFRPPTMVW